MTEEQFIGIQSLLDNIDEGLHLGIFLLVKYDLEHTSDFFFWLIIVYLYELF